MLPVSRWIGRMSFHACPLFLILLVAAGCAASSGGSSGPRDLITEEQILEVADRDHDAYQVVNRIRPQWLRTRGVASLSDPNPVTPVVYLDGTRFGTIDDLRRLNSNSIREIRYLGATDAQTRFGLNHSGGALLVTTRR